MKNYECEELTCLEDCTTCDRIPDFRKIEEAYFEEKMANDFYNNFNKFNL